MIFTTAVCDDCGMGAYGPDKKPMTWRNRDEASQGLKLRGWTVGRKVYCPTCGPRHRSREARAWARAY
jgi:hypothetical protein